VTPILLAILPIFLVILLGLAMRHFGFPGEGFWEPVNRVNYYLCFPALLIHTLARADFRGSGVVAMLGATAAAILVLSLLLLAARPSLRIGGPAFTSLFQGALRQNTFIGLAAAASLYGTSGLALSAVLLAGYVPLVNPIAIAVLVRYGRGDRGSGMAAMVREIARNPIPIACAIGLVLDLSGIGLPFGSAPLLDILGQASLALGLLATGAGLEGLPLRGARLPILLATVIKLALLPVLVWLPLAAFGVDGLALRIAVLFAALPSASGSYVLAAVLGGEAPLMAAIIVIETALAVVTMPLALAWLT